MAIYIPDSMPRRMSLLPRAEQKLQIAEAAYTKLKMLGLTPPPSRSPYTLQAPPADPSTLEQWDSPFSSFFDWINSIDSGDAAEIEILYTVLSTIGYTAVPATADATVNQSASVWPNTQSSLPKAVDSPGQLNLNGSNFQTTTLAANVALSTKGASVPGTFYRLEVVPGAFTLTIPAGIDPLTRFTQPAGVTRYVIGIETLSDGTLRYAGVI